MRALALAVLVAGCHSSESATAHTTLAAESGYTLLSVKNDRKQSDDVVATIENVDPGATYVLLFAREAPRNTGWFQYVPSGDVCVTFSACRTDGYGSIVDVETAAPGATTVTLKDERGEGDVTDTELSHADCDSADATCVYPKMDHWTARWAVMRVERSGRVSPVTFHVEAIAEVGDWATTPDITKLQ